MICCHHCIHRYHTLLSYSEIMCEINLKNFCGIFLCWTIINFFLFWYQSKIQHDCQSVIRFDWLSLRSLLLKSTLFEIKLGVNASDMNDPRVVLCKVYILLHGSEIQDDCQGRTTFKIESFWVTVKLKSILKLLNHLKSLAGIFLG